MSLRGGGANSSILYTQCSLQERAQTVMKPLCAIESNMTVAQRFTQAIVKARPHGRSVEALVTIVQSKHKGSIDGPEIMDFAVL